ncbi:MAG TPA: DinB family protein [Candidatus Acidoferrales bacterium]
MFACLFAALLLVPTAALAQEMAAPKPATQAAPAAAPANPITQSEKGFYGFVSGAVIKAAEKMPEENYAFKPTPEVRSFGQLVGHVADATYNFCSQVAGEPSPAKDIEKTKTSKADLVAAIKDAQAYCFKTYGNMTDAKGAEMMKMFGYPMAKITVLSINTAHTDEHYGNMVTYMRLKGIVPPTSENQPAPPAK